MPQFAFFDLDDTLVDRSLGFQEFIRRFCHELGFSENVESWLRRVMFDRAYRSDFLELHESFGIATPVDQLWHEYCRCMAEAVTCRPTVLAGLGRLRASGWRVAVVTNGAGDIQRAKLTRTGIAAAVDAVCISEEIGIRKPDAGIFMEAARMLGSAGQATGWMVGDSFQNDIVGGQRAGLRTIWLSADGAGSGPDHVVASAEEAMDVLLAIDTTRELGRS